MDTIEQIEAELRQVVLNVAYKIHDAAIQEFIDKVAPQARRPRQPAPTAADFGDTIKHAPQLLDNTPVTTTRDAIKLLLTERPRSQVDLQADVVKLLHLNGVDVDPKSVGAQIRKMRHGEHTVCGDLDELHLPTI